MSGQLHVEPIFIFDDVFFFFFLNALTSSLFTEFNKMDTKDVYLWASLLCVCNAIPVSDFYNTCIKLCLNGAFCAYFICSFRYFNLKLELLQATVMRYGTKEINIF